MARYLSLLSFTDEGRRDVQKSTARAADFHASVEAAGGKVISQYWVVGEFDGCVVFEMNDDETAAALLIGLGQAGNVRTQSMRLFDEAEFATIVAKV